MINFRCLFFISLKCFDNSVEFTLLSFLKKLRCLQFHLGWSCVFSSDKILLLCAFIMLAKLGKQLQLTLTLFLLNILWNLLVFEKCLSISLRKVFPMFSSKFTLYGGLNHIIFLCFILFEHGRSFWMRFSLYPLADNTFL